MLQLLVDLVEATISPDNPDWTLEHFLLYLFSNFSLHWSFVMSD